MIQRIDLPIPLDPPTTIILGGANADDVVAEASCVTARVYTAKCFDDKHTIIRNNNVIMTRCCTDCIIIMAFWIWISIQLRQVVTALLVN